MTFLNSAFRDQLASVAQQVKEPIAALTMKLAAVPAPTNDEGERARVLAEILREAGFDDVRIDDLDDVTARIRGRWWGSASRCWPFR